MTRVLLAPAALLLYLCFHLPRTLLEARAARRRLRSSPRFLQLTP